jgi:hypothetical protein
MVEVRDRTKESFQRLASPELPALYWLAGGWSGTEPRT